MRRAAIALALALSACAAAAQDGVEAPELDGAPEAPEPMSLEQAQARIADLEAALAAALQRAENARARALNLTLERSGLDVDLRQCARQTDRLEGDLRQARRDANDAERRARSAETALRGERRDRQRAEADARRYRSQARNCR
jgi:chromosome segregation ATPase